MLGHLSSSFIFILYYISHFAILHLFFFFNLFDLVWFDAMNLEHDTSVLTHI